MIKKLYIKKLYIKKLFILPLAFLCFVNNNLYAQVKSKIANVAFSTPASFIENKGQYGSTFKRYESMDSIVLGYEGFGMPVLFTKKGLIHLQRKVKKISKKEEERLEKLGVSETEIEHKKIITDQVITMEWIGANTNTQIIKEEQTYDYHTYGLLTEKAYGYKKITYKNLYNGIDLVYSFINDKIGFEYSFIVAVGADISQIKMRYGGDVKQNKKNKNGNLIIKSNIGIIEESLPITYYKDNKNEKIKATINIKANEVSFTLPDGYDTTRAIIIDPFVSNTNTLTGLNAGKAKDIDYDYAGNIYVTGGGDPDTNHKLAKYNNAGVLQWTFNGVLTTPSWAFGAFMGGWVVEKSTGNIYLGQGGVVNGFKIIRLNSTGIYDNYISIANSSFSENWKMYWNCNNGAAQILIAGGDGGNSNNFGLLSPPSTNISPLNITGIPLTNPGTSSVNGSNQDISDVVIDPINNDIYTIYSTYLTTLLNDKIYKNAAPYSSSSVLWNVPSGFTTLVEAVNRPYFINTSGFDFIDNSTNILALNNNYLFYWDGKNLKAFNKATGATVGSPLTLAANTALFSGGIYADACNNVYIGSTSGTIKVYNFNGIIFDDAPADISITGYPTKSVYDLAFKETDKLLYASGDGFVASFDFSTICNSNTIFNLNIVPNCTNATAITTLIPAAPAGSTITYTLYIGTTIIASNATGIFTGILPATNYKIIATINAACSGTQVTKNFALPIPTVTTATTNEICGNATGQIIATGAGSTAPYTYSINGTSFFTSGTFTGLASNTYTITVKDTYGCTSSAQAIIGNSSFTPTFSTSYVNTSCGNSTGTINATANGGIAPYQYSINNGVAYQSSNIFLGLGAGQYSLKVKDVNGCLSTTVLVDIAPSIAVSVSATHVNATCGLANGVITATSINGVGPYQYSINGGVTYQTSNIFTGLAPNTYTIKIKDVNGCTNTTAAIVLTNIAGATVTASSTNATCGLANGKITATAMGGNAPFQYSIDGGIIYQPSNIFNNLLAGPYFIKIKDANSCVNSTAIITVLNTAGATVTGVPTNSSCGFANGKITATPSGGISPFQYSKDGGSTFQSSNIFNGLLASTYSITIKDGNNCINTSPAITVSNTAGATLTGVPTNSTCGFANGKITATAAGGTSPFQYSLDGGTTFQSSNIFNGLLANTYSITIKDGNSCINNSIPITVSNTVAATVTGLPTNSICGFANGKITATANGGTVPFQYSLDGGVTYQTSTIFNNLLAATYSVTIKDGNNCLNISAPIIVANTAGANVTGVPTNSTCGFANGKITVTPTGGTTPFQYSLDGGITYQSSNIFTGLLASTYSIIIKDGNNCINNSLPITVSNTAGALVTATSSNATCGNNNGKITAIANGGTAAYQYSINGGASYQNANIFTNLAPTSYAITIKDANGCLNNTTVIVGNTLVPILQVFAGRDTTVVINQNLQLNALDINSIGFVSYTWSPTYGLNRLDIKNPISILDKDFSYEVIATTADGCIAKDSINIKIIFKSEIYVPTAFTPNSDGINDILKPNLVGIKALKYFTVYNRYGEIVFKTTTENKGWDGLIKGIAQNSGSYVWMAEAVDYVGRIVYRQGSCLLLR